MKIKLHTIILIFLLIAFGIALVVDTWNMPAKIEELNKQRLKDSLQIELLKSQLDTLKSKTQ